MEQQAAASSLPNRRPKKWLRYLNDALKIIKDDNNSMVCANIAFCILLFFYSLF